MLYIFAYNFLKCSATFSYTVALMLYSCYINLYVLLLTVFTTFVLFHKLKFYASFICLVCYFNHMILLHSLSFSVLLLRLFVLKQCSIVTLFYTSFTGSSSLQALV